MFSGFQSAFQSNAFQIVQAAPISDVELLGGGAAGKRTRETVYNPHAFKYRQQELAALKANERRQELHKIENELALAEQGKQQKIAQLEAKNAAKELAALEAQLQDEINRLRNERIWLVRLLDDEEAIFVLLMAKPIIH